MPLPTTRVGLARVRCFVGPCPVLHQSANQPPMRLYYPLMRPLLSVPGAAPLADIEATFRLTFE